MAIPINIDFGKEQTSVIIVHEITSTDYVLTAGLIQFKVNSIPWYGMEFPRNLHDDYKRKQFKEWLGGIESRRKAMH